MKVAPRTLKGIRKRDGKTSRSVFARTAGKGPRRKGGGGILRAEGRRTPQHLFDCWSHLARPLRLAEHLVLWLDFDGTLVRLGRRPDEVWLGDSTRRVLRRLARHPRVTLCVISGRRRADLRRRVRVPGVRYLGLHGWEQKGDVRKPRLSQRPLQRARRLIERRLRGLRSIWVENKELSFVVHYRGASPGAVRRAEAVLGEELERFAPQLGQLAGKKSWEVLPRQIEGKGSAVRSLLGDFPRAVLPIYVGDDTTDESAFAVLRRGLTVRVGAPRSTGARFFLRNSEEVMSFLEKLEAEIA